MKRFSLSKLVFLSASVILLSCNGTEKDQSKNSLKSADPLTDHIDSSINAADDFFTFANGEWLKQNPIPDAESSNGIFLIIQDSVNAAVRQICELSANKTNVSKGTNQQKIGDLFYSGMDTLSIDKQGIQPINAYLKAIDQIKSLEDVLNQTAVLHQIGAPAFFNFDVRQDEKKSEQMLVAFTQGGLGLPERDYYTNTDQRNAQIRDEYKLFIQKIFSLSGNSEQYAKNNAENIIRIETALAKGSRKMEALRDPYKNYNKLSVADFTQKTSNINWNNLLNKMGLSSVDSVNVGQPEFFGNLNLVIKETALEDLKIYLKWNVLAAYASYLSKEFEYADFLFYSQKLSGNKEQKPRWKRVVEFTDRALGELIGQEYVANYLPPNSKEKLIEIGNNTMQVYRERIKKCDWMGELTKQKALNKLSTVSMKIGYPDKWKDYSELEISRSSYAENALRISQWNFKQMVAKFGKPVDRNEWHMTPQTYNAYYNPCNNEIVIPACNILVPGYAKNEMPEDAILYGIIGGSTFGHEITHGFDDEGSLYDEKGNLNDWWTKADRANFKLRTQLMVEQFNNYVLLDTMHLRGLNTLGENLADLGGVVMGFEAFKKTKEGVANQIKNGYTANQRYFLAYAFAWMMQRRAEEDAKRIMTDVHSPAKYRVNGPLSNIPEFYQAFNVKSDNAMFRSDNVRVKIW